MFIIIIILSISLFLILLLKVVSYFIREKAILIREEISSYECGFEHHNLSRIPFSLRYFFLTLIFLLFDLEIVLIIFLPSVLFSVRYTFSFLILTVFLWVLFIRLIYEWNDGRLEWLN